jgi:uncharacterized protein
VSRKSILNVVAASLLSIAAAFLLVLPAPAGDSAAASPAIWKIDGPNGHVYLFGSIHILPKDYVWRTPELEAALTAAQQLVFEINIDDAQNPIIMTGLIAKLGILPQGQSLHKMMAPERRAQFDEVAKSLGLDPARMDRFRPWFAALTLSAIGIVKRNMKPGETMKPGMQATPGVDAQLWAWAKTAGKERAALETAEDQLHVFADLTDDEQVSYLVVTLDEVTKAPKEIDDLTSAWRRGDTEALDKHLNSDMDRFPALREALMHGRHVKWLPQIEAMLNDGRTHLVVVGAAHMVGKGSVIAMLRAKGIKIDGP